MNLFFYNVHLFFYVERFFFRVVFIFLVIFRISTRFVYIKKFKKSTCNSHQISLEMNTFMLISKILQEKQNTQKKEVFYVRKSD